MEQWKDIVGYEGKYQVSNLGNVRSLNYRKSGTIKEMKQRINNRGYSLVGLVKNRKQKYYSVHRLVAQAFITNPDNKSEVNHIDGNKTNNHADNLEWTTHKENIQHAFNEGLMANVSTLKASEACNKRIKCIDDNLIFNSIKEAAQYYNCSSSTISSMLRGNTKTAKGKKFTYLETNEAAQ